MNKSLRIIGFVLGILALAAVRFYAEALFYDPMIPFFKSNFTKAVALPELEVPKLLLHVSLRYGLNSLISLVLIYLAFAKKETVLFSAMVFAIAWVIFLAVFWYLVANFQPSGYLKLFYARRFLIQPLLLLILLPAFYYQKKISEP